MAKPKEVFVCQNCGAASPKWQGQCATCGEWNTLVAETAAAARGAKQAGPRAARADVSTSLAAEAVVDTPRMATGSAELDRVLGGGLVAGSVTLIGGDPGIGKSTLMLQAAAALAYNDDEHVTLQRSRYLSRLELLSQALKSIGVDAPLPEGAFYLWCSKEGLDGWELAALLAERSGLVVSPGELYGEDGRNFARLAVVQPDERLELAAARLEAS